jgi:hypothetical protein
MLILASRADLDQRGVLLHHEPVERHRDLLELAHLRPREAEREGHAPALVGLQARRRVDVDGGDLLGRVRRDLFDVHAARRRADHGDLALLAVEGEREVDLALDGRTGFDINRVDRQALGAGLDGRKPRAEHGLRRRAHRVLVAGELDAARLAAAARVHLGLHDPEAAAQRLGGGDRLVRGGRDAARRDRDAVGGEDLLGLVLVKIHPGIRGSWTTLPIVAKSAARGNLDEAGM